MTDEPQDRITITATAYMCGTALECEAGHTDVTIYDNPDDIGECAQECGVAEVEITFKRWVKEPKIWLEETNRD